MHVKRQTIGKFWPVPRKGTKYLATASHEKSKGIPLVVIMRDVLKFVRNKKELQGLINDDKVLINGKIVRDVKYPIILFDSLSFPSIKKYYRAVLENKKISIKEITEAESKKRIYKVIDKKLLKGKKVQVNLINGRNILLEEKINTGDFIVLDSNNKVIKVLELQKGSKAVVTKGKHIGAEGSVKNVSEEGGSKIVELSSKDGDIKVHIKNIFLTE